MREGFFVEGGAAREEISVISGSESLSLSSSIRADCDMS